MRREQIDGLLILILAIGTLFGCGHANNKSRVMVLGLDGVDPKVINLLMSEGKLPHFAELRMNGAYGDLKSMEPLLSPVVWTTIATGKTPDKHGIGHFVSQSKDGKKQPVTSNLRQVSALWNMFTSMERTVDVVGWWATWPPENVNGSIISDHTCYHFLFEQGFQPSTDVSTMTHPQSLMSEIAPFIQRPSDLSFSDLEPFINITQSDFQAAFDFEHDVSHFKWLLATANSYSRIASYLWKKNEPDLLLAYIEGTDTVSHLFGHLFRREGLVGELAEQQNRYGNAVESIYIYADQILGEFMELMDSNTTLIVISDHGFDLGRAHDDPSKTRDMRKVSEAFHRLDGIIYMYGKNIRPNFPIQDASIIDVTPTILAASGLPVARDMPGRVLSEAFISMNEPVTIDSYESEEWKHLTNESDSEISDEMMAHLQSLGYVGTSVNTDNDRNMASIHFEAGNYAEAERLYRSLIEANPQDAGLLVSLSGVLGTLEKFDEAASLLTKALELDPASENCHHNIGVIHERRGQPAQAIESYRTALRYRPDFEPSQAALIRLTGSERSAYSSADPGSPTLALIDEAQVLAKSGDYGQSFERLLKAEALSPDYPLVQQYIANVAYLQGDTARALRALERGLKLEPNNALFQKNIDQLRARLAANNGN